MDLKAVDPWFKALAEAGSDGIAIFSPLTNSDGQIEDLVFRYINRQGEALTEVSADKLIGRPVREVLLPQTVKDLLAPAIHVAQSGQVVEADYEYVSRSGFHRWVQVRIVRSEIGVIFFARDITQQVDSLTKLRESERRFQAQQEKILYTSKMSALGEVGATIAHEINNPLTIISGQADLIRTHVASGKLTPNDTLRSAEIIKKTVDRISKIIRGLRTFARNSDHDPFEKVSLFTVIDETLAFVASRLRSYSIELDIPAIPSDLLIECRPTEISQVLVNLLNNAKDAIMDLPEKWIKVDFLDLGDKIVLSVTDSGDGIPESVRTRIMEPFFTTKSVGQGTGLGLSVSSRIAREHQGTLFLDAKCQNTRFVLQIPKTQPT